jgi:hypothetical protein
MLRLLFGWSQKILTTTPLKTAGQANTIPLKNALTKTVRTGGAGGTQRKEKGIFFACTVPQAHVCSFVLRMAKKPARPWLK